MNDYAQWVKRAEAAEAEVWILRKALSLARSMILSGESMSPLAQGVIDGALRIDGTLRHE